MLTVQFVRHDGKPIRTLGPFPLVRLDAASLHAGADGEEIAHYDGGVWSTTDFGAPKYTIHGTACRFRFEGEQADKSSSFGPVDQVDVVDGAVYIPPGHRLLAHYREEQKAWFVYRENRFWPSVVMEHCADREDG